MKNLLLIILSIFLLTSCVTQRKCAAKFPPQITSTTIIKDSVVYRDTTITVPGDTVTFTDSIPCPDVVYEKTQKSEKGTVKATVKIKDGKISVKCEVDSLNMVIRNLQYRLRTIEKEKTIAVQVPVLKKTPWWKSALQLIYGIVIAAILLVVFLWLYRVFK